MTEHTGHARPLPAAGWYPDPEDPRYLRWWSGHSWELRKPVPGTRTPIGRGFERLGQGLGVLLVFNVLLSCAIVALQAWGLGSVVDGVQVGDLEKAQRFDDLNVTLAVAELVSILVTGVVWMVWQFQLARATAGLRRSPAMHAFSWIIPIGNLWLPFQNVRELWQRVLPVRDTMTLGLWWAGWIASEAIARLFLRDDQVDSVSDLRGQMWASLVVAAMAVVTAVLAGRIMRALTRGARTSDLVSREGSLSA